MKVVRFLFLLVFVCPSWAAASSKADEGSLSCRDEKGRAVDWWVIAKQPGTLDTYLYRDAKSQDDCIANGIEDDCFDVRKMGLNSPDKSPLSQTLQPVIKGAASKSLAYLSYNDQSVILGTRSGYAHAKGIAAFSAQGGLWLTHSVPKFPQSLFVYGRYEGLPSSAKVNGQSLMCVSLSAGSDDEVAEHLMIMRPFVEQSFVPDKLQKSISPQMQDFLEGKKRAESSKKVTKLLTANGEAVVLFAKSKDFYDDVYKALIAPYFGADLYVETWQRGNATNLPNFCEGADCRRIRFPNGSNACSVECVMKNDTSCLFQHNVVNIGSVEIGRDNSWDNMQDHSKWAVSMDGKQGVFCISDINRQESQRRRGGGAVCIKDKGLWEAFSDAVEEVGSCQMRSSKRQK